MYPAADIIDLGLGLQCLDTSWRKAFVHLPHCIDAEDLLQLAKHCWISVLCWAEAVQSTQLVCSLLCSSIIFKAVREDSNLMQSLRQSIQVLVVPSLSTRVLQNWWLGARLYFRWCSGYPLSFCLSCQGRQSQPCRKQQQRRQPGQLTQTSFPLTFSKGSSQI